MKCVDSLLLFARRFVDGIETENQSGSSQKFDFSPSATRSALSSPDLAAAGEHKHTCTVAYINLTHISSSKMIIIRQIEIANV